MAGTHGDKLFVRDSAGKVWGPLLPLTVEQLFDHHIIAGDVQVSLDGDKYVKAGLLPAIRKCIPKEFWGSEVAPEPTATTRMTAQSPAQATATATAQTQPIRQQNRAQAAPAQPQAQPARPQPNASAPAAATQSMGSAQPQQSQTQPNTHAQARAPQAQTQPNAPAQPQAQPKPQAAGTAAPTQSMGPAMAGPGAVANAMRSTAAAGSAQARPGRPMDPNIGQAVPAKPPGTGTAVAPQGDLSQVSFVHLYYLMAVNDRGGLITLRLPDRVIEVHFRKGNPERVDSNHPDDALATFLVRGRLATPEQLAKAETEKMRYGGELIGALFGLNILNPATAFQHLATRALGILARAFAADRGAYKAEGKELEPHRAMPLGNRWAVLAEQCRKIPYGEIRKQMDSLADFPVMKSPGRIGFDQLRLTPQEARALSYFDGVKSLAQLEAAVQPADREHFFRVAWLLRHLEMVSFAAVKLPRPPLPIVEAAPAKPEPLSPAEMTPPPVAPIPKPAMAHHAVKQTPSPKPVTPVPVTKAPPKHEDMEAEAKSLIETLEKMKKLNYFEILELPPKADPQSVKIAYFKMAKQYHPDTVYPGAPEILMKVKADIFAMIGNAHKTLTDDKSRAEYIADLEAGGGPNKVDVARIFAAEELFNRGVILVKARKFPEAVKILDEAIKANADEGEFYAYRGFAKFFLNTDRTQSYGDALEDIKECLKRNERCSSVWYFQGMMQKILGDLPSAKKHFEKAVELAPHNIDAQRELRVIK